MMYFFGSYCWGLESKMLVFRLSSDPVCFYCRMYADVEIQK